MKLRLALEILTGYLAAFGVQLPGVALLLRGAPDVSFDFDDAKRRYVAVTRLGKALGGRSLDLRQSGRDHLHRAAERALGHRFGPLMPGLFRGRRPVAVRGCQINPKALKELAANVEVGTTVSGRRGRDLVFQGPPDLTFAFSCVRFVIGDNGTLASIEPESGAPSLGFGRHGVVVETPNRVLLTTAPELLDSDDAEWPS